MREIVGLTFLIYKDREGGTPLWMETQNVNPEADGKYSAILGATKDLPLDLFVSGEPRWVGVQVNLPGEDEQPRIQLVSVPFALKAADAETLGGKPLSAFVLVPEGAQGTHSETKRGLPTGAITVGPQAAATQNYIAKFLDGSGTTGDSVIYQSGTNLGIGTTTPGAKLEVQGPVYLNAEGSGFVVDAGFKRMGFMKYAGLEAAFTRFSGTGLRFGRTASLDITEGTAANFTLEMLITGTGDVGIGTPSPEKKLHVNGSIRLTGNVGGPNPDGITFPDGTTQTSACAVLFSADGRSGRPNGVTPAGGVDGNPAECSATASLQQVVQEQRTQIQRLQSEVESLKQRLDVLVGARQ